MTWSGRPGMSQWMTQQEADTAASVTSLSGQWLGQRHSRVSLSV